MPWSARALWWGFCLLALAGPALAQDSAPGCPLRPLAANAHQLKAVPGVMSVVVDETSTHATLIFFNGDVLRLGTTGCVTPMISARLWVAGDDTLTDAMWLDRARDVARLALSPASSAKVVASLQGDAAVTHADGGLKMERAMGDGAGYSLAVVRAPHDSLGASLSMVFRHL